MNITQHVLYIGGIVIMKMMLTICTTSNFTSSIPIIPLIKPYAIIFTLISTGLSNKSFLVLFFLNCSKATMDRFLSLWTPILETECLISVIGLACFLILISSKLECYQQPTTSFPSGHSESQSLLQGLKVWPYIVLILKQYLFIFGYAGSLLLCGLFL